MKKFSLAVVLTGVDQVSTTFTRITRSADAMARRFDRVGRKLTLGVTAPVVGLGAAIFKVTADFDRGMNRVRALTGATGEEFEKTSTLARQLGASTVFTAGEAAGAMANFAQAGFKVNEILAATPSVLHMAAAGELDLADSARKASDILRGMARPASELPAIVDVLTKAMTNVNANFGELAEGFSYTGAESLLAGQSFATTAAALAKLADLGQKGSRGGTALRSMLLSLAGEASSTKKALASIGIRRSDIFQEDGTIKPLWDIIEAFERVNALGHMGALNTIFGERAIGGFAGLLRLGSKELREFEARIQDSEGAAKTFANQLLEGSAGAMEKLRSATEGLLIAIGKSGFVEWVTRGIEKLTAWTESLSKTSPRLLRFGSIVALTAAALGPLSYGIGALIRIGGLFRASTGLLITVLFKLGKVLFLTVVPAVFKLATAIVVNTIPALSWLGGVIFVKVVPALFNLGATVLLKTIPPLIRLAGVILSTVIPAVLGLTLALLTNPFTWVAVGIASLVAGAIWLYDNWNWVTQKLGDAWDWVGEKFSKLMDLLQGGVEWIVRKLPKGMQAKLGFSTEIATSAPAVDTARIADRTFGTGEGRNPTARVEVDFRNVPRGVDIKPRENRGVDLGLEQGYSLGTVYG